MEDQNQTAPQSAPPNPTQVVDVVMQPKPSEPPASVAAPDPELISEPSVEPAPAPEPTESDTPEPQDAGPAADTASVDVAQQTKPKHASTTPVGAIIVAILVFIALATVAFIAFKQGL